jgi:hypothetical protein
MNKYILLATIIIAPALGLALSRNLEIAHELRNEGAYQNYYDGRGGGSGTRAQDIEGYEYENDDLTNKLYKRNTKYNVNHEGVQVHQFLTWKNARRHAYWQSHGDNRSYKKAFGHKIERTELRKPRTVDLKKREAKLDGELSGREKLARLYR